MAARSDYFTEMVNLHLLSLEKTFYAMDSYLGLNQKDEINMQIDKIKKVVYDLNGKLQKVKINRDRVPFSLTLFISFCFISHLVE